MRQGSNGRRPRGRPNRKQHGGPPRSNNFDSNGPEGRIRGNAHQVYEKYVALGRDAISAGDRIAAETFFQHAEHYFRIMNSSTDPASDQRGPGGRHGGNGRADDGHWSQATQSRSVETPGPDSGAGAPDLVNGQPAAEAEAQPRPDGPAKADRPARGEGKVSAQPRRRPRADGPPVQEPAAPEPAPAEQPGSGTAGEPVPEGETGPA